MSHLRGGSRKFFTDMCNEMFCKDDSPIPPEVKSLDEYSAYLRYKELCMINGEDPDIHFVDNDSFFATINEVCLPVQLVL